MITVFFEAQEQESNENYGAMKQKHCRSREAAETLIMSLIINKLDDSLPPMAPGISVIQILWKQ